MKNKKGFVVSAVLYPLLVLFLAIIMGLLSMTDTRKRILDKMKLEITDNIFDDAACSCDTILAKLNYIIANGTGGSGGDTGSYAYNKLTLNVKTYEAYSDFPVVGNIIGDIAVLSTTPIKNYYVSTSVPKSPQEGTVWIVQDNTSNYYVTSDWNKIGISYVMQYENSKWVLKKSYVYNGESWTMLYYVNLKNNYVDLTGTDINAEITKTYDYTGKYQTFKAVFSGYYKIELWGAQGKTVNTSNSTGGKGSYTSGEIYLNAGEILYVYVGGQPTSITGGWNGGGNGYSSSGTGGGGGGATDIRLTNSTSQDQWSDFESLKSRIMVAAGGAGGCVHANDWYSSGGNGGTVAGEISLTLSSNSSGYKTLAPSQSYGGVSITKTYPGQSGSFGRGGDSQTNNWAGSGGGGGYYGGAGSAYACSYTSGGSSYISGHNGCSSIEEESTIINIIHNGSAYHYSGKYFVNTEMKSAQRSGNGYAKITLQSVIVKDSLEKTDNMYNRNYVFSGQYQKFNIEKTGTYRIELWGAQGGSYGRTGGKGSYTSGNIYLDTDKIKKLYVYVGEQPLFENGGWNGGGKGISAKGTGSGGGGATDIRLILNDDWKEFSSLKTRIMVASGGGGGANHDASSWYSTGGAGGGLTGINGTGSSNANGYMPSVPTQTIGGFPLSNNNPSENGEFGYGGNSQTNDWAGGGGGGGYYGGTGSTYAAGPTNGGSSYISGYEGCSSIYENSEKSSIIHSGNAYHYSGYYFNNASMESGQSEGSGKVKITYLGEKNLTTKSNENNEYFYFSQTYQLFTVNKAGTYAIELWGAQGGSNGKPGGFGGYTYGEIKLNVGQKLYIYVGEMPKGYTYVNGGWNGGGKGLSAKGTGSGGGGATDIRTIATSLLSSWNEATSLKSRIMVAAGGGGGSAHDNSSWYSTGGAGGGLISNIGSGTSNSSSYSGTAANQIAGGKPFSNYSGQGGGFGFGGDSVSYTWAAGGGGSGWYGGAGGSYASGLNSGGSSYISGHAGCIGVNSSGKSLASTYSKLADSISYTGYTFINTQMIDGAGYPWTTEKSGSSSGMPSKEGKTVVGNTGDGYAKITYLGS